MDNPSELSDAEFMTWAGVDPARWALLPTEKRERWLDYLIARVQIEPESEERNTYWRLAYAIVSSDDHSTFDDDM